ncbi:MAG: thioesterase family protein [Pseudomonadota bacterium]
MSAGFRYYLRTRVSECDLQGVVFNARYGEYVDLAVTEFFRALGYGAELKNYELDYQLVKQTTEWKSPARFDDVLEISVLSKHLGNTSFTMACEFRRAGQTDLLASSETVYVLVDHDSLTKKKLPDALRANIERGVDAATDHAAYLKL